VVERSGTVKRSSAVERSGMEATNPVAAQKAGGTAPAAVVEITRLWLHL
jgi:hypothetical protein